MFTNPFTAAALSDLPVAGSDKRIVVTIYQFLFAFCMLSSTVSALFLDAYINLLDRHVAAPALYGVPLSIT